MLAVGCGGSSSDTSGSGAASGSSAQAGSAGDAGTGGAGTSGSAGASGSATAGEAGATGSAGSSGDGGSGGSIPKTTLPGVQYLGRGYDVFGPYATPDGVRGVIFNLGPNTKTITYNGVDYGAPSTVSELDLETADFESNVGSSATEYLTTLANSASLSGSYSFFSGSLMTDFTESQYTASSVYFVQLMNVIRKFDVQLPPAGSSTLTALLDPQFAMDLDTLDPDTLFLTYGPYYLRDAVVGARADFNETVNTATTIAKSSLSIYARASYDSGVGHVTATDNSLMTSDVMNYNQNATQNLVVIGGDAELGQSIFQSGDYDQWIASIASTPVLAGFTPTSLVPIWTLLPDGARKTELEDAFVPYAQNHAVSGVLGQDALVAIQFQDNGSNPAAFPGYTQINQDLNQGAAGDYIYLNYKTAPATGAGPFISSLTVFDGTNPPTNDPSYTFITTQDLNKGSGGDDLYLGYSTTTDANQAIKSIAVVAGGSSSSAVYGDYTPVTLYNDTTPADLNKSTGGKFIYIEVKH
jgi:hypothetical protein